MSPELLAAVRERIEIGHPKADIVSELKAAGYSDEMVEEIYVAASASETVAGAIPPYQGGSLVGYSALLAEGVALARHNWKLFVKAFLAVAALGLCALIVIVGLVAAGISAETALQESPGMIVGFSIVAIILFLFLAIAFKIVSFSIIKNLTSPDKTETFTTSLKWSAKNIISIILLSLFVYLATQTGYLLLVIPGIAFALYAYFSDYVFATQGLRGLDAVVRSTEIVYGRWWAVLGRLLMMTLVVFLVVIVSLIGVVLGLEATGVSLYAGGGLPALTLLVALGYLMFLFVVMVFIHCVVVVLFQSLQATVKTEVFSNERKTQIRFWFKLMVIFGPIAAILLQVPGMMSELDVAENTPLAESEYVSLASQANAAYFVSEEYYLNDGEFSYVGVCEQVPSVIADGVEVECNATAEEWAVRLTDTTGSWCTDSTEYDKQSYVALDGATSCLALPSAGGSGEVEATSTASSTEASL